MQTIQFIGITPADLKKELVKDLKNSLLFELSKEFQPKKPTEYLTRTEVAKLLKIDLSTLWSYTKKNKLISYGIGNRVLYKRAEVENALVQLKH